MRSARRAQPAVQRSAAVAVVALAAARVVMRRPLNRLQRLRLRASRHAAKTVCI
jgi:hypothetical protein